MLDDYKEQFKTTGTITLRIKVHAGARETRIKSILADGTIKIDIANAPEAGKANQALVQFLAQEFDVSAMNVVVLMGKFSGDKTVRIEK